MQDGKWNWPLVDILSLGAAHINEHFDARLGIKPAEEVGGEEGTVYVYDWEIKLLAQVTMHDPFLIGPYLRPETDTGEPEEEPHA